MSATTTVSVSALVVITLFMIVSLLSLHAAPQAANAQVAVAASGQLNG